MVAGSLDYFFRFVTQKNQFLLQIGTDGSDEERGKLEALVNSMSVIRTFRGVNVVRI